MASDYGYITVADLEAFAVKDYGTIDSRYIDAVVEAQISHAERIVNEFKGQSYSGTIPDDVKSATLEISKRLMKNVMIEDGHAADDEVILEEYITKVLERLLKDSSAKYDYKLIANVTDRFFD